MTSNQLNYSAIYELYCKYYSRYRSVLPISVVSESRLHKYCFNKAYKKVNKNNKL